MSGASLENEPANEAPFRLSVGFVVKGQVSGKRATRRGAVIIPARHGRNVLVALIVTLALHRVGSHAAAKNTSSRSALQTTSETREATPATTTAESSIIIDSPQSETVVRSPLIVSGMVRGPWFFEGAFPIILKDAEGKVLGAVSAHPDGNWMATDTFVAFHAELTFER